MKYHSAPLIPHKSALMSAPAKFYHAAPAIRREHRRSAASMKYFFPAPTFLAARQDSAPLIPHKSALMSAPANLLAEEGCLPAALLKKSLPTPIPQAPARCCA
jgi:hypothetical protein